MKENSDILPDDESLEKEAPLLHSISKENLFPIPEGYFDGLTSEIIEKCRTQTNPKKWGEGIVYILLSYKWKLLTVASCGVIIYLFAINLNSRPVSYEVIAKNIPDSLIIQHLDNNIATINESTLEDFQGLENTESTIKSNSDSTNTDQDIIAYLIDHNINESDIENE